MISSSRNELVSSSHQDANERSEQAQGQRDFRKLNAPPAVVTGKITQSVGPLWEFSQRVRSPTVREGRFARLVLRRHGATPRYLASNLVTRPSLTVGLPTPS